jgi:hypothetical protein
LVHEVGALSVNFLTNGDTTVAKYKLPERNGMFVPVVLEEQLHVGTFESALNQLGDHELDFKALDDRFCNDQTGAPAYDPRTLI